MFEEVGRGWADTAHPRSLFKETINGSALFPQENI